MNDKIDGNSVIQVLACNSFRPLEKNLHSQRQPQLQSSILDPYIYVKLTYGRNYEVRYAGGLNKRPFLHPNATKPFWVSTIFKQVQDVTDFVCPPFSNLCKG